MNENISKIEVIKNIFKNKFYKIILIVSILLSIILPLFGLKFIMPSFEEQIMFNIVDESKRVSKHLISVYKDNKDFSHMKSMQADLNMEKIKFFDDKGLIVYSTSKKDIGKLNTRDYFHNIVAKGEIFYKIVKKGKKSLEGRKIESDVAEVYIPIMENDKFVYAFEVYYDITKKIQNFENLTFKITILNYIMVTIIMILILIKLFTSSRANLEQKIFQQHLEESKKIAEEATKAKSDFLASMSHEIRTPLNAILGFVSLLKEKHQEDDRAKYINTIDNSSHTLLGIINDILDMSKIENGKLDIEKIDFNPYCEFEAVAELFKAKAQEKNLIFNLDIDKNIPTSLNSDSLRLKQIVSNLLSNAIKFTPKNKDVTLKIGYKDNNLTVSVKDSGIGIAPEAQAKIFTPFSQAENSTARKFGGTGLGLSISLALSEMLGGKLKLKSKLNEGSEFYFSIPVTIGKTVFTNDDNIQEENKNLNAHILLVEDNEANIMFMKIILKKMGLTFDIAYNGYEAIDKFKESKYNLILMDENMPNMNGIEATKKILEIEEQSDLVHTPIIALTANALKGDRERFLNVGMDEYLTKPLNREKLYSVLQELL